jgi:hypothetical protein
LGFETLAVQAAICTVEATRHPVLQPLPACPLPTACLLLHDINFTLSTTNLGMCWFQLAVQ